MNSVVFSVGVWIFHTYVNYIIFYRIILALLLLLLLLIYNILLIYILIESNSLFTRFIYLFNHSDAFVQFIPFYFSSTVV